MIVAILDSLNLLLQSWVIFLLTLTLLIFFLDVSRFLGRKSPIVKKSFVWVFTIHILAL